MKTTFLILALLVLQTTPKTPSKPAAKTTVQESKPTPSESSKPKPQEPVAISQLPPVTVTVQTDGWTKAYVILTGLLVLVGVGGALLALQTLAAIRRQGLSMRRQTTLLRRSAKHARTAADAAKRSADTAEQTLRLTERADVLLESAGPTFPGEYRELTGDSQIIFRFKNFGRTRASSVSFRVRLIIPDVPDTEAPPLPSMVMGANQEQSVAFAPLREFLNERTFNDIMRGRVAMQFESWVVYRDVFGSGYTTRDVGIFESTSRTFRVQEHTSG